MVRAIGGVPHDSARIPNTAMGPHPLPDTAVWQLEAFVRSIDTLGATARGSRAQPVSFAYEELAAIRGG